MKAFSKSVVRMFTRNKGRFLANFATVLLSIMITAGLGALPETLSASFVENYTAAPVHDLDVKAKTKTGFSLDDINVIATTEGVESYAPFLNFDFKEGNEYYRFYVFDFATLPLSRPKVVEGAYPTAYGEVAVEVASKNRKSYAVGTTVEFPSLALFAPKSLKVTGVLKSPLYNTVAKERAMLEDEQAKEYISAILYLEKNSMPKFLREYYTDCYVRYTMEHSYLETSYDDAVKAKGITMESRVGTAKTKCLSLLETTSYGLFKNYNEKVSSIGLVFPLFFILVGGLVNLIIVTRLIKEERPLIACYSSLGVSSSKILGKYSAFSMISVFLGAVAGMLLGTPILPYFVYPAYSTVFTMNSIHPIFFDLVGFVTALALLLLSFLTTLISSLGFLKENPAELTKEKSPKPGKKILLEKMPWLWKRISFSFKSTFRNIFRHKKNTILTALSVVGSTLLVLFGLGLLDVSHALVNDDLFSDVAKSMGAISTIIVLFAAAMAITVIYSLAVMNVQDRVRELATLKVLGYHDRECSSYTFREIIVVSAVASLLGLPLSAGVLAGVFQYLNFGTIGDVQWYSYVLSFVIVILLTVFVNVLLFPRIKKIDMNDSLKSVE